MIVFQIKKFAPTCEGIGGGADKGGRIISKDLSYIQRFEDFHIQTCIILVIGDPGEITICS